MQRRRNDKSAFGLFELLISLLVGSIVLLALHRIILSTTRSNVVELRMGSVSRRAAVLKLRLENALRNLGHNPKLIPYITCTADPTTDPDCVLAPIRFGITKPESAAIEFNSDENEDGILDPSDQKGFWIAGANSTALMNFQDLVEPAKPTCIPRDNVSFTTTYRLYEKSGSNSSVLADNILCFELRYYRYSRADDTTTDRWVRVCPANSTQTNCPSAGTEVLKDPATFEKDFYSTVRDIRRVEVGILLAGPEGKVEHVGFDFLLANPPWLIAPFAGKI